MKKVSSHRDPVGWSDASPPKDLRAPPGLSEPASADLTPLAARPRLVRGSALSQALQRVHQLDAARGASSAAGASSAVVSPVSNRGPAASQTRHTGDTAVDSLQGERGWFGALLTFRMPPGHEPNAVMIDRYNRGQASAHEILVDTTQCIRRSSGDWNVALNCLEALSRCRHPSTAEGVFPNPVSYTAAMSICAKAGRFDKALALFEHLARHGPGRGVAPNTRVYNAAIEACRRSGQWEQALDIFDQLQTQGPDHHAYPDAGTYRAAITACTEHRQPDMALALFYRLRDEVEAGRLFPDRATYNAVLTACSQAGQWNQALEVLKHMQTFGPAHQVFPNLQTYDAALAACAKGEKAEEFAGLLRAGMTGVHGYPHSRVFQPALGFHAASNTLHLHDRAVLAQPVVPHRESRTVPPHVAQAIFHVLLREPERVWGPGVSGINAGTTFFFGGDVPNVTRDAMAECMRQQGWTPATPVHGGHPDLRRLVVGMAPTPRPAAQAVPVNLNAGAFEPGRAEGTSDVARRVSPGLNPDAAEYQPRWR